MPTPWARSALRLHALLKRAKLSSAQLARELKCHPSTIVKYRKGSRVPDGPTLAYMVSRAGGSADEILGLPRAGLSPDDTAVVLASLLGSLEHAQASTAESAEKLTAAVEALKKQQQ